MSSIKIAILRIIPKMGFPRGVLPPKVKTWEWSAVTTVSVSDSLVICAARSIARSNISASVSASFAMPSWCPWSILPRNTTQKRQISTTAHDHAQSGFCVISGTTLKISAFLCSCLDFIFNNNPMILIFHKQEVSFWILPEDLNCFFGHLHNRWVSCGIPENIKSHVLCFKKT